MAKTTIIRNIKGIKELSIDNDDLAKLDRRIIGVYGANGAGKSSFKNGVLKDDMVYNWELAANNDFTQIVDHKIDYSSKKHAIFDERIVNLVRNKSKAGVQVLGDEVFNLYDLLTNRTKFLESRNAIENLDKGILSVEKTIFSEVKKSFEDFNWYLDEVKIDKDDKRLNVNSKLADLLFESISKIFNKFIDAAGTISTNAASQKYVSFTGIKPNDLFKFLDKLLQKQEVFETDLIAAKSYIDSLKMFLDDLFFVITNFGYIELGNQLNEVVLKFNVFFDSSRVRNQNAKKIFNFVNSAQQDNNLVAYSKIWIDLLKTVQKVISITNNFLETYDLNYSVTLKPTIIQKSISTTSDNFSLMHNKSNKKLSDTEIEKYVSFGELNIIALALFISSVLVRGIQPDTALIFDDPVSSYDLNRVQITINIIKNTLASDSKVSKIMFLSHEKHFIKSLKFVFRDDISYWNLIKDNISELRHVETMQSDFEFYEGLLNAEDPISKLIAERFFAELRENQPQNIRTKSEVQKDLYNNTNWEEIEIPRASNLKRNDLISLKTKIWKKHPRFWNWMWEKATEITDKIATDQEITESDKSIYRATMYQNILNSINHSDDSVAISLDISRTSEKIDILYASKERMMDDLFFALDKFNSENN